MWFFRHDPSPIPSGGVTLAVTLACLVLPSLARAQPQDPRQAALDDLVAARMLATKCPSWQLNPAEAQRRFSELDLKPADWQDGGRYAKFFDERLSYYGRLLSRMPEQRVCAAAEEAFGLRGRVRGGWMRRQ
jgi:hypothetical protein